jgi:hypothetical protein
MRQATRDILGLLCRWVLLGGAAASLAAALLLSVTAVGALAAGRAQPLRMDDTPTAPGALVRVRGRHGYSSPDEIPVALLALGPDAPSWLLPGAGPQVRGYIPGPPPGVHHAHVRGLPYGPLAYQQDGFLLVSMDPAQRLFLLDARLAIGERAAAPQQVRAALRALRTRGQAAFFHVGPAEAYADVRRVLRKRFPGTPVLRGPGPDQPVAVFLSVVWGWTGRPNRPPALITGDRDLAHEAANMKRPHPAHWVGGPPTAAVGRLHVHRSLDRLAEALAPGSPAGS